MTVAPSRVDVGRRGDTTVITVSGSLDSVAAEAVHEAARAAVSVEGPLRVEIDLRGMEAWTSAGLRQIAACGGLGIRVRMGPSVARST